MRPALWLSWDVTEEEANNGGALTHTDTNNEATEPALAITFSVIKLQITPYNNGLLNQIIPAEAWRIYQTWKHTLITSKLQKQLLR